MSTRAFEALSGLASWIPRRAASPARPAGLDALVKLQRASGVWELDEALAQVLGRRLEDIRRAMPAVDVPVDATARAWATALAVAWLERHASAQQDEWRTLAVKAHRWLGREHDGRPARWHIVGGRRARVAERDAVSNGQVARRCSGPRRSSARGRATTDRRRASAPPPSHRAAPARTRARRATAWTTAASSSSCRPVTRVPVVGHEIDEHAVGAKHQIRRDGASGVREARAHRLAARRGLTRGREQGPTRHGGSISPAGAMMQRSLKRVTVSLCVISSPAMSTTVNSAAALIRIDAGAPMKR